MNCKKSLERAIVIGKMINYGLEPIFMFSSVESYKNIPPIDDAGEDDVDVFSVQFNQDGTEIVTGGMNSTVRVINTAQPNRKLTIKPSKFILGMPITCIRYMPVKYDRIIACSPSGHLYMSQANKEGFETIITEQNETYAFDISTDGMELATCGRDRNIRIYRFANAGFCEETRLGSFIPKFIPMAVDEDMREMGHGMTIHAVKFHPDNSCQIVSAGWDNIVKVNYIYDQCLSSTINCQMWDTRAKINPIWKISGPHVCSPDGIDIKGNEIFTASWRARNALQIWDLRNPTLTNIPLDTVPVIGKGWNCEIGDTEYLYGVKVGDNHSIITSGSGFSGIRVVNRANHRPIGEVYAASCVNGLDIAFGGRQIVAGCSDGRIILCRMN